MHEDCGEPIKELRIDGGAANNNLMVQFQADISKLNIVRPQNLETTALGAAYLAGLAVGFWSQDAINQAQRIDQQFTPHLPDDEIIKLKSYWQKAVARSKGWVE
jgi:glycerol kinase